MSVMQYGDGQPREPIDARCRALAGTVATTQEELPAPLIAGSEQAGTGLRDKRSPGLERATGGRTRPKALIGRRVGTYLITERLGAGGAAEVFKGIDLMLKRDVAIKVLRPENASTLSFPERFRHEAQILARLSHPNIAAVHAFLCEGDTQFMVMEYVPGISLDAFIRAGGPVPPERALSIFRPALDGIGHAHRCGIVHRDLKPANIMLTEGGHVKVVDFGIARAVGADHHLTRHGQVPGTAKYMSPEQVRGEEVDARSDIYSLGVVLYMLLCGRAPFVGPSMYDLMRSQVEQAPPPLHTLVAGVPLRLEAAVARALAKHPSERFQSVEAFCGMLDACLAEMLRPSPVTRLNARPRETPATQPDIPVQAPDPEAIRNVRSGMVARWRHRAGRSIAAADVRLAMFAWLRRTDLLAFAPTSALLGRLQRTDRRFLALLGLAPLAVGTALVLSSAMRSEASVAAQSPVAPAIADATRPQQLAVNVVKPTLTITRSPFGTASTYKFKPGERIQLNIKPSRDAHVYCYLEDEVGRIVRFFPNRFKKSALVKTDAPLQAPGTMGFELVANEWKVKETVACFATERDVMTELPQAVAGTDFADLPVTSLEQVTSAFARVGGNQLAEARFALQFE